MSIIHLHYTPSNKESIDQARISAASFKDNGWECTLVEGYTPQTVTLTDYTSSFIENGRTHNLLQHNHGVIMTKIAILSNHVRFWKMVVESNKTQIYAEHDVVCNQNVFSLPEFDDVMALHISQENIKTQAVLFHGFYFEQYKLPIRDDGSYSLPVDWPIKYMYKTRYRYAKIMPTAACYAITPKGALKLLNAIEEHGSEQGDMLINDKTVDMKYCVPSLVINQVNKISISMDPKESEEKHGL